MKLRELIEIADCVDMRIKDCESEAEVSGENFDLMRMLNEKWLEATVRNVDVQGGEMTVRVEEDAE